MSEVWGPVIGSLGFTALIVATVVINRIIKFKLEIAKINAETTIKAEEIRARNQLEIEKLIIGGQKINSNDNKHLSSGFLSDDELCEKPNRVREKL